MKSIKSIENINQLDEYDYRDQQDQNHQIKLTLEHMPSRSVEYDNPQDYQSKRRHLPL